MSSEDDDHPLVGLVQRLEGAVSSAQGLLAAMGESVNAKYREEALRDAAELELSPSDTEEDRPKIDVLTKLNKEAKKRDKQKQKERLEDRKRRLKAAEERAAETDPDPISCKEFARLIQVLIEVIPSYIPSFEAREYLKKAVGDAKLGKKLQEAGIKEFYMTTSCLEYTRKAITILQHIEKNVIDHKKLNLNHLDTHGRLSVLKLYYERPNGVGRPGNMLGIQSAPFLRTTVDYIKKHYPHWKPNKLVKEQLIMKG